MLKYLDESLPIQGRGWSTWDGRPQLSVCRSCRGRSFHYSHRGSVGGKITRVQRRENARHSNVVVCYISLVVLRSDNHHQRDRVGMITFPRSHHSRAQRVQHMRAPKYQIFLSRYLLLLI